MYRKQLDVRFSAMRALSLCAVLTTGLSAGLAQAQPRERHEEARLRTPHLVYDERFSHNRFYPAPGYSLPALPADRIAVGFRNGRYFFHAGVWYQRAGNRYVVIRPPMGIVVPALPAGYSVVSVAGVPYYYANDIYYNAVPGGYAVAQAPAEAMVQAPPPAPGVPMAMPTQPGAGASLASPGTWYYCESAHGYYPHVPQCSEPWRAVPAAPR